MLDLSHEIYVVLVEPASSALTLCQLETGKVGVFHMDATVLETPPWLLT